MILKLSLDLPEDGAYVPLTRQFGRVLLQYLKVMPADIGDVDTIITELVANVVRHANSSSGRFQIVIEYYAERVVITVIDAGHEFTFRDIPAIGSVRPELNGGVRLGGFGLPLLDLLTDRLDFYRTDPHGTTVCAEKFLSYGNKEDSDAAVSMNVAGGGDVRVISGALERRDAQSQMDQLHAANRELGALATTDRLTGLLNFRAFQSRLDEESAFVDDVAAVARLDLDDFGILNHTHGHAVGDGVLRQVANRLKEVCGAEEAVAHFCGDDFTILLPHLIGATKPCEVEAMFTAGLSGLTYHLANGIDTIPISVSVGAALLPSGPRDWYEALRKADQRLHRAKTGGDAETEADLVRDEARRSLLGFSMLDALVTAVDNKDRYTRRHSEDVMGYSLAIARALGMDEAAVHTVAVSALVHDVGKIGVPDAILRKPGKLTDEEFEVVKQHPRVGAIMVGAVPGLEDTLDAVLHHHERWDGAGYPLGLNGADTPLNARIMAVADAFSAMTMDRPYRNAMHRDKALSILASGAGSQWNPQCVATFLLVQQDVMDAHRAIDSPPFREGQGVGSGDSDFHRAA